MLYGHYAGNNKSFPDFVQKEKQMNDKCFRKCAYKDLCNLDGENTSKCKVADDKQSQDFKESTIMGRKTEELLEMQYK